MNANFKIRMAQPFDLKRVIAAYEAWGYRRGVAESDTVWMAEAGGELIGVVRIAPENGILVLRGMRLAEPWRRLRIGSAMLRVLAEWLGERECFCVPYSHLIEFYGQIGFVEIDPGAAPRFLAVRLAEYKAGGLDVTIMARRAGGADVPPSPQSLKDPKSLKHRPQACLESVSAIPQGQKGRSSRSRALEKMSK